MKMYSIIVVDDEPTAINHLCTLIQKKCLAFYVVATAENGQEGLEKIKEYQPDIVLTDIKMPVMSGIEMVKELYERKVDTLPIIISGHQEFEYAQTAIKSGVVGYLLKPIRPKDLIEVLERIRMNLQNKEYIQRNRLVKGLINGEIIEENKVKRYFASETYYGAIIRRNGLPRRFTTSDEREIFSPVEDMIFTYGRDEMEVLYLCPKEAVEQKAFQKLIEKKAKDIKYVADYMTSVIYYKSFSAFEIGRVIKELYRSLDSYVVIGKSQYLIVGDKKIKESILPLKEERILEKVEFFLKKNSKDKVFPAIKEWLKEIESLSRTQLVLEGSIRKILYLLQRYEQQHMITYQEEVMLEDAFYYATTLEELIESLQDIVGKYLKVEKVVAEKIDTPEFLEGVKAYIQANIAEEISLPFICKRFGVSQTYLSKIFRKYEETSFNNYLINLRIEKAKELLRDSEGIYIKDVAAMVGYKDQFYFSRIFRSIVGVCPSDYSGS